MRYSLLVLALLLAAKTATADLMFGAFTANQKVRPDDVPTNLTSSAELKAARNEFEPFQVVFTSSTSQTDDVAVVIKDTLTGPGGATIPDTNITLYRAAYYDVGTASNSEGAPGLWPDPLIPDTDTYVGEKRNAFPFSVPVGKSRVVWVDILVPVNAAAGDYDGSLEIRVGGNAVGTVPIHLKVGNFTLPSTASLPSAFALDYALPCYAHTGFESCTPQFTEIAALTLRERYIRSGLEHRFSIHDPFFQPPFDESGTNFAQHILPHIKGTATDIRLQGARLTTVRIGEDQPNKLARWIDYAKQEGFFERLFYWPVDEPSNNSEWNKFSNRADDLHATDSEARIILTAPINQADDKGVTDKVDIFVPVINHIEERENAGTPYDGNQRPTYDAWLAADPRRKLWSYQSCLSHGCGSCGTPSPAIDDTGWPNRVIDSSAVQNRAFPWVAFRLDLRGELYFAVAEQLETAWDPDGQCKFSGSGDGTIFYPGKPSIIGGTTDIPIESIRIKMIREGMEDYEYLTLLNQIDPVKALQIATNLFPHAYESVQTAQKLESARNELFTLLDQAAPPPPTDGGISGGDAGVAGDGSSGGGGGCSIASTRDIADRQFGSLWLFALLALTLASRRRIR